MRRPNLQQRLANVRSDLADLRESMTILDEQLSHAEQVALDAQTRAVVEGSPAADRERDVAEGDVRRIHREREETAARIDALSAQQDALLEELFSRVQQGSRA